MLFLSRSGKTWIQTQCSEASKFHNKITQYHINLISVTTHEEYDKKSHIFRFTTSHGAVFEQFHKTCCYITILSINWHRPSPWHQKKNLRVRWSPTTNSTGKQDRTNSLLIGWLQVFLLLNHPVYPFSSPYLYWLTYKSVTTPNSSIKSPVYYIVPCLLSHLKRSNCKKSIACLVKTLKWLVKSAYEPSGPSGRNLSRFP